MAVIAECVEGGGWNGVDGVRPDQFLDIDDVAIAGVLGASAGPQEALLLCSFCRQSSPAWTAQNLVAARVGQLGIGDGYLTSEAVLFGCGQTVDRGIDAAHEKTGDAGNVTEILAGGGTSFEARDVRLGHLLIH